MNVTEDEILEEISGFLTGYLKSGRLRINSFLSKINTNISNLEQLLIIRFLLRDDVKDFARELPILLRRFKTTTVQHTEIQTGEVRGQINWDETFKRRMAENPKDRTVFATSESIRSYSATENRVLKELLESLYKVLYKDKYIIGFQNREWYAEWQSLKENIAHAYKKNVYMQRIDNRSVSERDIRKTMHHRSKLYRDAAKLLSSYRMLIHKSYTMEDIREILQETFIAPENKDVLFELYWVVQLIKNNTEESRLYILDGSHNLVASWEKEQQEYHLYHNSAGSDRISFHIAAREVEASNNPYLERKYDSFTSYNKLANTFFNRTPNNSLWRGRPDFLLEVLDKDTGELVKLIIGEVKNTSRVEYASTGLAELLDYVHFVKDSKGEYLFGGSVIVQGMLCVGNVPVNEALDTDLIRVVKRGRNEDELKF